MLIWIAKLEKLIVITLSVVAIALLLTHNPLSSIVQASDRVLGGKKMGEFVQNWLKEEWASTNPVKPSCLN